ncbi:MAG: phosphocholine cytidylyltransferase family protein [Clostridia bacterium]|nr:phosphocholine cytidylyltransferase family protein [Clostridia bacterium]
MTYIFLVAGKGSRLHPLTLNHPKSLYKLDGEVTVLERMVALIKKHDSEAEIVIVTGFMSDLIEEKMKENVHFIRNPFYDVTNSIASLWFAKDYLNRDDVVIINGDIVMEEELIKDIVCSWTEKPMVLLDSSIKTDGDYNVQVEDDVVLVMSKDLNDYYGEYAGVTKLEKESAHLLSKEISYMVNNHMHDQWYENALVQMIFKTDFKLYYKDICDYKWTEVDCVSDMLLAKKIHNQEK